jgi:hypothetical protein
MRYTNANLMLRDAREHAAQHQHQIVSACTPQERLIGFACADCPATDATVWECDVLRLRLLTDEFLLDSFRSEAGRQALAAGMSSGDRFVEFDPTVDLDGGITPEEQTRLEGLWDTLPAVDWELPRGDDDGHTR